MFRDFSRRNQKSNNNKIKVGLEICFLVGVCLWVMYQIRHTYDDSKKEFDPQSNWTVKSVINERKLGRKDLKPKIQETVISMEDLKEEEDDENGIEKEKKKLEDEDEEDLEFKKKNDENNMKLDRKDDGIDENASSEIQSETFGDVTGVHTNFLDQNVDTEDKRTVINTNFLNQKVDSEDKRTVIEEDGPAILVRDENQKQKGL